MVLTGLLPDPLDGHALLADDAPDQLRVHGHLRHHTQTHISHQTQQLMRRTASGASSSGVG